MEVILTHAQADFDGLGAMIEARRLHPRATIVLPHSLNANVRRFVGLYRDAFGMRSLSELDPAEVTHVILVDTQDPMRAGDVRALLERPDVRWTIIDHHPPSDRLPKGADATIERVGAASTIVARALREREATLAPPEATALLLGIYEDTGRLMYPSTTPDDAEAVAYLLAQGARLADLPDYLEPALTAIQAELLDAMRSAADIVRISDHETLLIALDHPAIVEGQALVLERLMTLYQPAIAIAVVRTKGHTQITARSSRPAIDLRALLAPWGAKGHPAAASAHVPAEVDLLDFRERLEERLAAIVAPPLRARDIMSRPVRTLRFEDTVQEALDTLRSWGHSAMPVVHGGRVRA